MPRKTASLPASQNGFKDAMVGWKPNSLLRGRTWSAGMPRLGRKSRYRPLVYGITVFRPSLPPDRDSTTNTLSFVEAMTHSSPLQCSCFKPRPLQRTGALPDQQNWNSEVEASIWNVSPHLRVNSVRSAAVP